MEKDMKSEILGYVLFVFGLVLIWYEYSFLIALAIGVLLFGFALMIGGYMLILVKGIHAKIDEESKESR